MKSAVGKNMPSSNVKPGKETCGKHLSCKGLTVTIKSMQNFIRCENCRGLQIHILPRRKESWNLQNWNGETVEPKRWSKFRCEENAKPPKIVTI